MALPINIVTQFNNITRYRLDRYLNDFAEFINQQRRDIVEYYSGEVQRPNTSSFDKLKHLLTESRRINSLIEVHKDRMNSAAFWELIELLTEVQEALNTVDNASKWLRSAITRNNFNPNVEVETVMKQFQTLEQISNVLGSNNGDDDWYKVALRNDLREEDYTVEGGNVISSSYRNKLTINLRSVVDNISGEKVYGIDLDRKLTFENDDLRALSYRDTIFQTVEVLAGLRSGQTPEFPTDGIQVNLVSGSNRNAIPFPVLFRQFTETFQKDDTLKALKIKNIENDQDLLKIDFEVETRFGEVVPTQTTF